MEEKNKTLLELIQNKFNEVSQQVPNNSAGGNTKAAAQQQVDSNQVVELVVVVKSKRTGL